jgi:hypothetical protein
MHRSLLALLVMSCVLMGCVHCVVNDRPSALTGPQLASLITDDTAALVSDFGSLDNTHRPYCTAVWVARDTLLTANHCVTGYQYMLHKAQIIEALVDAGLPPELAIFLAKQNIEAMDLDDPNVPPELKAYVVIAHSVGVVPVGALDMVFTNATSIVDVGVAPRHTWHSRVLATYKAQDVALLRADSYIPPHGVAKLAKSGPVIGDEIYTVGQSHGFWFSFKRFTVSAYRAHIDSDDDNPPGSDEVHVGAMIQVDGNMVHGDSGGGDFNAAGELVGMNDLKEEESRFGFCVDTQTLRSILIGAHVMPAKIDVNQPDPSLDD